MFPGSPVPPGAVLPILENRRRAVTPWPWHPSCLATPCFAIVAWSSHLSALHRNRDVLRGRAYSELCSGFCSIEMLAGHGGDQHRSFSISLVWAVVSALRNRLALYGSPE